MDLQEYKDKHPLQEDRLTKMEKRAKEAEILLDLKEHPGVKRLTDELTADIARIDTILLNKRITEHERDLLFMQRDCWNMLLGRFAQAEITIVNINKYLEKL